MHLPKFDGDGDGMDEAVAPATWIGGLISSVLGNLLPGPGTTYISQQLHFHAPVLAGNELKVTVTVVEKREGGEVLLDTRATLTGGARRGVRLGGGPDASQKAGVRGRAYPRPAAQPPPPF
jgi:acyl dehydratase